MATMTGTKAQRKQEAIRTKATTLNLIRLALVKRQMSIERATVLMSLIAAERSLAGQQALQTLVTTELTK